MSSDGWTAIYEAYQATVIAVWLLAGIDIPRKLVGWAARLLLECD